MHRLGRGLPGYLILFATHAFVSQRQLRSRKPSTPPVFLLISTHFTATPGIPLSSPVLYSPSTRRPHPPHTTGVPPDIYAFHRYTRNSTFLSRTLVPQYSAHPPG